MKETNFAVLCLFGLLLFVLAACDSSITLRVGGDIDGDIEDYTEFDIEAQGEDGDTEYASGDEAESDPDIELYCGELTDLFEACPGGEPGDNHNYLVCAGDWLTLCRTIEPGDPCTSGWITQYQELYQCAFGCVEEQPGQADCIDNPQDGDLEIESGEEAEAEYAEEYAEFENEAETVVEDDLEPEAESETEAETEPEGEDEAKLCAIEGFVRIIGQSSHAGTLLLLSAEDFNASGVSTASGYFRFDNLECRLYSLSYTHDNTISEESYIEISFEAPGATYEAELWLIPAGRISGSVTMDGAPLNGATVYVSGGETAVRSNADGYYRTPLLPAGFYDLTAFYPGCNGASENNIEVKYAQTVTVDFALQPYSPGGTGAVEGTVDVFNLSDDSGSRISLIGPQSFDTLTASDGSYRFQDIPAGGYLLRIERPTYRSIDVKGIIVTPNSSFAVPPQTLQYGALRATLNNGHARIFQTTSMNTLLYADYDSSSLGDIYSLPVTNGPPQRLARGIYVESYVNYTPDSHGLIFKRNYNISEGSFDLYWTPFSARGGERLIDRNISGSYTFDFSDGLIYFKQSPGGDNSYDLYRYDFVLESSQLAAHDVYRNLYMENDGLHYLVLRNYDGLRRSADIWRINPSEPSEELIIENVYCYNFAYSHNSALLAVMRITDVQHNLADLLTVDMATLEVTRLGGNVAPDYIEFGHNDEEVLVFANLDTQKQRGDLLAFGLDGSSETLAQDIYRYQFYWQNNYDVLTFFSYSDTERSFGLRRLKRSNGDNRIIDDDVYPGFLYDMEYYGIMIYFKNFDLQSRSGDLYRYWYSDGHSELFVADANSDHMRFAQADGDNWLYYFIDFQTALQSGELRRSTFTGSENEFIDDGVHVSYSFLPDSSLLYLDDFGQTVDKAGELSYRKAGGSTVKLLAHNVKNGSYTRAYWYDEIYLLADGGCFEVPLGDFDSLLIYEKAGAVFDSARFIQTAPERELFIVVEDAGQPAYMRPGIWEIRPPHTARSTVFVK